MLRHGPATAPALSLVTSLSLIPMFSGATAESLSFKVAFSNCQEFVGEGPVALEPAQRLVPQGYALTALPSGQTPIVVQMTQCEAVQVEGARAVPTIISQIGINIVPPDGTGTINNYTLVYVTNNSFLAEALARIGVPAGYDPSIVYEYTRDGGHGGVLYGAVPDARVPAYFLHGSETEPPPNAQRFFVANWWRGTGELPKVRQQTTFPAVSSGAANVTLYTSRYSPLGQLIGGNAYDNFSMLAVRRVYGSAEMIVSESGR